MEFSWEEKSPYSSAHFFVVKSVELSCQKRFGGQGNAKSPAPKLKDENPEQELVGSSNSPSRDLTANANKRKTMIWF